MMSFLLACLKSDKTKETETEKEKNMKTISSAQVANAIENYRKIEGWRWKSKLKTDWSDGSYSRAHREYEWVLQRLRNEGGFELLEVVKAKDSVETIKLFWDKEVLIDLLNRADCIEVDGSPLLSHWEVDNGLLSYSFVPDENCDAEEYEVDVAHAKSIGINENGTWQVLVENGLFEINCYVLEAMKVTE